MRLAVEEESEQVATRQVFEFLDMIIEEVSSLLFHALRLPPQCGEHFWRAYRGRVEEQLQVILGMERIYWAIRRGFGALPRRRDYSVAHRFKTLPLSALEDAQKRWDMHCDSLRESCESLKVIARTARTVGGGGVDSLQFSIGEYFDSEGVEVTFTVNEAGQEPVADSRWYHQIPEEAVTAIPSVNLEISPEELDFLKATIPVIKLTHTIFKKIKLRYLSNDCPELPSRSSRASPRRIQLDD